MNESPKNDPEAIRSDIDTTRRRMDDTMDALGDRLKPRHLLDEFLGHLRGHSGDAETRLKEMGQKLGHSCNTAMNSVVDTIKQNPMPAVLIGAGVTWMILASRRDDSRRYMSDDYSAEDAAQRYDPDTHYDRPLEYPPGDEQAWNEQVSSDFKTSKEGIASRAASAKRQVKEKLSHAGEVAREKMGSLRERAGEVTGRVRQNTREAYERTRERVVETADHHPLEVGLLALAAGLVAGLAIPTPNAVNRSVGPAADRLRSRTREMGREMVEKGRHVAGAVVSAAKEEARAQGLTPERLREKGMAVAERAKEAGEQTAQREGLSQPSSTGNPQASSGNPSVARPAV